MPKEQKEPEMMSFAPAPNLEEKTNEPEMMSFALAANLKEQTNEPEKKMPEPLFGATGKSKEPAVAKQMEVKTPEPTTQPQQSEKKVEDAKPADLNTSLLLNVS